MFFIIIGSGSPRLDTMASCGQQLGAAALMALPMAVALMVACCSGIDSGSIDNGTDNGSGIGDRGSG